VYAFDLPQPIIRRVAFFRANRNDTRAKAEKNFCFYSSVYNFIFVFACRCICEHRENVKIIFHLLKGISLLPSRKNPHRYF
jgi:hypothetical protein